MDIRWTTQSLALLLVCLISSCNSAKDDLFPDHQSLLPTNISILTDPAVLVGGQMVTLTAVADIARPHGTVAYVWEVAELGTFVPTVGPTLPAAPPPSGGGNSTSNVQPVKGASTVIVTPGTLPEGSDLGTPGTNRAITVSLQDVEGSTAQSATGHVTIEVTWNGVTNLQSYDFTVSITPAPEIVTSISPLTVTAGVETTFSAAVNSPEDFTYQWDFGSAATVVDPTQSNPQAMFLTAGKATVILRIYSKETPPKLLGSKQVEVTVTPAPGASTQITGIVPTVVTVGVETTFGATLSPPGDFDYLWDFGSAATVPDPTLAHPQATFLAPGDAVVTLSIYSKTAPFARLHYVKPTIKVDPAASISNFAPLTAVAGTPAQFSAKVTSGSAFSYEWIFDPAVTKDETDPAKPIATFPAAGPWIVTLNIRSTTNPAVVLATEQQTITVT